MDNKSNIELHDIGDNMKLVVDTENPHLGGNVRGGDPRCDDHGVWDYLIDTFKPKTICDVGCGEGHLMSYFVRKGIYSNGVDGLQDNKDNAVVGVGESIYIHDYTKGIQPVVIPVDMTVSCEFVEHVEEKYIPNYLPQFCACKTLVFTHALPNQAGHHHVHCKSDKYWIDLIKSAGFELLVEETEHARSLVQNSFWGTLLIFKKL